MDDLDPVWKALADPTRRGILDLLRERPRTTTEIVDAFPNLSRFGVMKHLDTLREAGLVQTRESGRFRVNSLNAVPIRQIYERWVSRFEELWANHMLRLKRTPSARTGRRAVPQPAAAAWGLGAALVERPQPARRQKAEKVSVRAVPRDRTTNFGLQFRSIKAGRDADPDCSRHPEATGVQWILHLLRFDYETIKFVLRCRFNAWPSQTERTALNPFGAASY